MNDLGYANNYKVLNAKDYGVPQNRERVFVFSIRKDVTGASAFRFPRPFPLKRKLRNILEEDVDEKYYLKDEIVERFLRKTAENKEKGLGFAFNPPTADGVSYTLRCQCYGGPEDARFINLLGREDGFGQPAVIEKDMKQDNKIKQVGNISDSPHNPLWTRVYSPEGNAPTLNAMMGTGGNNEPLMLQSQPRYHIRKLTERECFRLMGVEDADIDTIQASGVSRSAQYKMAGNSIVVDVLYHIFRQAFTDDLDTSGAVVETIKVDVQQLKLF